MNLFKYMFIAWDQNAEWSHSIQTDNSSFERMEQFKYLGTTLMYQNSIQEESFVYQFAIQKYKD